MCCGSHVGKTEKKIGPLFLKSHQGKYWNLTHGKYSSWGTRDFFMISSVSSLWRQNCICRMLHIISMKNFESYLWIKWSTFKKNHDVNGHVIRQTYCWKKNLHKTSLKCLNRSRRNFTCMTAHPWGTKASNIWHHRSHGLAAILYLP